MKRGAAEQVRSRRCPLRLPRRLPGRIPAPARHLAGPTRHRRRPGLCACPPARCIKRNVVEAVVRSARLRDSPREAASLNIAVQTIRHWSGDAVLRLGALTQGVGVGVGVEVKVKG